MSEAEMIGDEVVTETFIQVMSRLVRRLSSSPSGMSSDLSSEVTVTGDQMRHTIGSSKMADFFCNIGDNASAHKRSSDF